MKKATSCLSTGTTYYSQRSPSSQPLWNGIVLFYGPPGTGKTTLSKALAQKLSIRYNAVIPHAKLVEVDCHALYSKFFSESAKLVGRAFEDIVKMLAEEQDTLICVLIDEIESMAGTREVNEGSNEPKDAMRVRYLPSYLVRGTFKLTYVGC